jgi:hypothetical protein
MLGEGQQLFAEVLISVFVEEAGKSGEQFFLGFYAVELAGRAVDVQYADTPDTLFEMALRQAVSRARRSVTPLAISSSR